MDGGAVELPGPMREAALQRAMTFERAGGPAGQSAGSQLAGALPARPSAERRCATTAAAG
jgi:hypothetical protein